MPVSRRAIAGQKVGQKHVFEYINHLGSKKGHTTLFSDYPAEVHSRFYNGNEQRIATHSAASRNCMVAQPEHLGFREWAAILSRVVPNQKRSLNSFNVWRLLKLTKRFTLVSPLQVNHRSSIFVKARGTLWRAYTGIKTGFLDSNCKGECSPCVLKSIRVEGFYDTENVTNAYIAQRIFRTVWLIDPEDKILVAIMNDIKSCHPHRHAPSRRVTNVGDDSIWVASPLKSAERGTSLLKEWTVCCEFIAWIFQA